jgi:hypothetical protein
LRIEVRNSLDRLHLAILARRQRSSQWETAPNSGRAASIGRRSGVVRISRKGAKPQRTSEGTSRGAEGRGAEGKSEEARRRSGESLAFQILTSEYRTSVAVNSSTTPATLRM